MRILLALIVGGWIASGAGSAPRFDLVIRGGRVVDGIGTAAYFSDIGVKRGRIAAIRRGLPAGKVEIDAAGQVVCPGFIDVHTHSESIASMPEAENFIRMGVTSIVTGNCGGSAADLGTLFRAVDRGRIAVNV